MSYTNTNGQKRKRVIIALTLLTAMAFIAPGTGSCGALCSTCPRYLPSST